MFWFFKKNHIKGEKHITQMDIAEYIRKLDVSENTKHYYGRFLWNGLHERIVTLNVDEMYKILEILLANPFRQQIKVGLYDQSFCWVCPSMSMHWLCTCFIKG